jgi:hypothetical protein
MAVVLGGGNSIYLASFGGSPPPVLDSDAIAFLTAAGIVDPTIESAVNTLVVDMKAANIWAKMKALYPFVGGTATTHKFNLINTVNFEITWNGGITHDSNGITGSVNGYGNTSLVPNSFLSLNSTHVSVNIKTAAASSSRSVLGTMNSGFTNGLYIYPKISNQIYFDVNASSGGNNPLPNTIENGFFVINRVNSTQQSAYRNGGSLGTSTRNSSSRSTQPLTVLASNINGSISDYYNGGTLNFISVGDGLTPTEITNLNTAVNAFNTALSR